MTYISHMHTHNLNWWLLANARGWSLTYDPIYNLINDVSLFHLCLPRTPGVSDLAENDAEPICTCG